MMNRILLIRTYRKWIIQSSRKARRKKRGRIVIRRERRKIKWRRRRKLRCSLRLRRYRLRRSFKILKLLKENQRKRLRSPKMKNIWQRRLRRD